MKNYLLYYYNFNVDEIRQENSAYYFEYNGYYYSFFPYYGDISLLNEILSFNKLLLDSGCYCHRIILNKESNICTNIDDKSYILLECLSERNSTIKEVDIFNLNGIQVKTNKLRCDDWKSLWIKKLDYFEYQLNQFGNNYPLLRRSFGYFSGYVDLAIRLLNEIDHNMEKVLVISHRRLNSNTNYFELYNPFNLIVDCRVRDIAEYFKDIFVQKKTTDGLVEYIVDILKNGDFQVYEYQLFFIRMMYPTFYFDMFEYIINNNIDDDQISDLISIIPNYELMLFRLYSMLNQYLPNISWLNKGYG